MDLNQPVAIGPVTLPLWMWIAIAVAFLILLLIVRRR